MVIEYNTSTKTFSIDEPISILKAKLKAARAATNIHPTEGQRKADNYKKGEVNMLGFTIKIENPKGTYRSGKDKDGKPWSIKMPSDYGYFKGTKGKDGDAIDVFIGDNLKSDQIFVIDQYFDGKFDESKVMLGYNSSKSAQDAYDSSHDMKTWKGTNKITTVSMDDFKKWLFDGKKQGKPFSEYKI